MCFANFEVLSLKYKSKLLTPILITVLNEQSFLNAFANLCYLDDIEVQNSFVKLIFGPFSFFLTFSSCKYAIL